MDLPISAQVHKSFGVHQPKNTEIDLFLKQKYEGQQTNLISPLQLPSKALFTFTIFCFYLIKI